MNQCRDCCGQESRQQRQGRFPTDEKNARQIDHQCHNGLEQAHGLIEAEHRAADVGHQQAKQIAPPELIELGRGGGEHLMQQLQSQLIGQPGTQALLADRHPRLQLTAQ